ncbi:MAG: hypothetical protein CL840_19580 [Crocinitomicaceae bacterium]|nr:hypothetical protein [Crocinitomicaceae bacterium]|tara:strand:- start:15258 stop:15899 length:642 start_codon:yes stop_codon:yes gene_type:complete
MRHFIILFLFLFGSQVINAQDKDRKLEVGVTALTLMNDPYILIDVPNYEDHKNALDNRAFTQYFNEVFLRYRINRLSIRANSSYFQFRNTWSEDCPDCSVGEIEYKDFKIGLGVQYSLIKEKEWLYTYLNASYHHLSQLGWYEGGITGGFHPVDYQYHGVYSTLGVGFKKTFFKRINVSPELGYSFDIIELANFNNTSWYHELIFKLPVTVSF